MPGSLEGQSYGTVPGSGTGAAEPAGLEQIEGRLLTAFAGFTDVCHRQAGGEKFGQQPPFSRSQGLDRSPKLLG